MSSWGPSQDLRESFSRDADSDSDARIRLWLASPHLRSETEQNHAHRMAAEEEDSASQVGKDAEMLEQAF